MLERNSVICGYRLNSPAPMFEHVCSLCAHLGLCVCPVQPLHIPGNTNINCFFFPFWNSSEDGSREYVGLYAAKTWIWTFSQYLKSADVFLADLSSDTQQQASVRGLLPLCNLGLLIWQCVNAAFVLVPFVWLHCVLVLSCVVLCCPLCWGSPAWGKCLFCTVILFPCYTGCKYCLELMSL